MPPIAAKLRTGMPAHSGRTGRHSKRKGKRK